MLNHFPQRDRADGGAEGDPPSDGGRGALHRASGGVAPQAAQARQHRDASRHCAHHPYAYLRLRIRGGCLYLSTFNCYLC